MRYLLITLLGMFSFEACNQSTTEVTLEKIATLETQLIKAEDVQKDMEAAKELIQLSERFYKENPQHPRTPELLLKAGDVARGLGNPGKAIQLWGFLWRDYPDAENAAESLFLQALTFETMLNDKDNAKRYYMKFIDKFPDHKLANQALTSMQQLELTPEQLIEQFQKQHKE